MITIIYITCRKDCRIEWFLDSLHRQRTPTTPPLQLVIVDSILDIMGDERKMHIHTHVNGRFDYVHVAPKPTMWQGPHRITTRDFFCAANPRNTGVCYAKYDYIAFVDDLGVLAPTWLAQVVDGMQKQRIYCGAYTKMNAMDVSGGILISGHAEAGDVDHRLSYYKSNISECPDSHLFGSSFCMPIKVFLDVNGLNENCGSCGYEDCEFGIRLKRAGHALYYNKGMFIHESKDISDFDSVQTKIRVDPEVDRSTFIRVMTRYNISSPSLNHRLDFSHFLIYMARSGPINVNPGFSLRKYRSEISAGNTIPFLFPDVNARHPLTDQLVSTM